MTGFDPIFGINDGGQGPTKLSVFEYLTRLILPALSLVAMILTREHTHLFWALLGLTLLFLGIGFYPPARASVRKRIERAKDRRVAKRAFPELRKFVHRFGEFVDNRTSDTLHYILQREVCQGFGDRFEKLGIPELGLWHGFWEHFAQRVDRQRPRLSELPYVVSEFYNLVGLYNNSCVMRILNNSSQEFRAGLTPAAKNSLNLFQQRFGTLPRQL